MRLFTDMDYKCYKSLAVGFVFLVNGFVRELLYWVLGLTLLAAVSTDAWGTGTWTNGTA